MGFEAGGCDKLSAGEGGKLSMVETFLSIKARHQLVIPCLSRSRP
jgi:hypothetical protein